MLRATETGFAFWLRQELRVSVCPSVRPSGTSLSKALNLHLSLIDRVNTMNHPRFLKLLIYIYFRKDILIHTKVKTFTETQLSSSKRK